MPASISLRTLVGSRPFLIASLAYLAVLILFFWPLLIGRSLHAGAQTSLSYPFISAASIDAAPYVSEWEADFVEQFSWFEEYQYRAARQGRFPTWNPHIYMGQPFHADGQSAMLFPSHWIYFLVDPNLARGPTAILRLWVSAMALFCLLRTFQLSPTAAFVGGSVWIFGSFNMHWLLWPMSNASLWLPVVLLMLDRLMIKPSWRGYATASLGSTPLFLSGHPGSIYLCACLIVVYVAIRLIGWALVGVAIRQLLAIAAAASAAILTGLLAASVAVLPLFMQIRRSAEYLDVNAHRNAISPLPWDTLWLFLIPEYFGRPRGKFPGFDYSGPENYIEMTLWFGALGLVLATAGIAGALLSPGRSASGGPRNRFSFLPFFGIVVFTVSLLTAFDVRPIHQIVAAIPGMQLTNLRRAFVAAQFAGAILAAWATHQILLRGDRKVAIGAIALTVLACATVGCTLCLRWDQLQENWTRARNSLPGEWGINWPRLIGPMSQQYAGFRMIAGGVVLFAGSALLLRIIYLSLGNRPVSPTLRYLFAAVVTLDVLLPGYDFNPIAPLRLAVPPAPQVLADMVAQTGDGRMAGISNILDPNMSMHYGFADIRGYDLPHNQRQADLFKRLQIDGFDRRGILNFDRFYPRILPEMAAYFDRSCLRTVLLHHPDPRAAKLLSSLKLAGDRHGDGFRDWPQVASPGNGLLVFSNPNSYPRVFFAKIAQQVTDPHLAVDALLDHAVDLRDRSVYESDRRDAPLINVEKPSAGIAAIRVDEPENIVIECQTDSTHLLVLEDRMDEGWKVRMDGKSTEPLIANFMFRGVMVPAGHHEIEWTYHAPGLELGIIISMCTVASMLCLLFFGPSHATNRGEQGQARGAHV